MSYAASLYQKEQLLLWASFFGIALLALSRTICVFLVDTEWGGMLHSALSAIAPFPYMGTAIGTLLISALLVIAVNCLVPEEEVGLWLYHAERFNQLESLILSSAVGVAPSKKLSVPGLLVCQLKLDPRRFWFGLMRALGREREDGLFSCFPAGNPRPLMVTLADGKVYVGLVSQLPPVAASKFEHLRLLPIWSGYRNPSDKRVYRTTEYEKAVLTENQDRDVLIKILPTKDICSIGLYSDGTFPIVDVPIAVHKPRQRNRRRGR
jgi:hypothetical protein